MDTDSDYEDFYGNAAKRLATIKQKMMQSCDEYSQVTEIFPVEKVEDSDSDGGTLDAIIAKYYNENTRKSPARKTEIPGNSSASSNNLIDLDTSVVCVSSGTESSINNVRGRGRKKKSSTRGKAKKGRKGVTTRSSPGNSSLNTTNETNNDSEVIGPVSRTRSRRGQGRAHTRSRQRPPYLSQYIPTVSIGNTDDYPDNSECQPLFSNTTNTKVDDVVENVLDSDDSFENEELSVKVDWQNREIVKFNIRRFQKLKPIFEFFAERDKVDYEHLYLAYNDKRFTPNDSPDSIGYSIVKFIEGGVTKMKIPIDYAPNEKDVPDKNAIKLKFQCQNVKKPLEVYLKPEDKLRIAMLKCAESLEKPIKNLKFYFDGDLIAGNLLPKDLDLEGGECIDVKICDN